MLKVNGETRIGAWGDFDNDGFLDLYLANQGHVNDASITPLNTLYRGNGDGTFQPITAGSPVTDVGYSTGVLWADLNNSGFLDLVVANGRHGSVDQGDLVFMYKNNGNDNNWIRISCVGSVGSEELYGRLQPLSNRSGIGAKVRVKAHYRGEDRWQMREIAGGGGFFHSSPLEAHFGLGDAEVIDTLRIEWPSGVSQERRNVEVNQILAIQEQPPGLWLIRPAVVNDHFHFTVQGDAGVICRIEVSSDLENWKLVETVTGSVDGIPIQVPLSGEMEFQFVRAVSE